MTSEECKKFRQVYADLLASPDMPYDKALEIRELHWTGERLCLADLVHLFGQLNTVNEFDPNVFAQLHAAFFNSGIEATPGRDYSELVYLHISDGFKTQVKDFVQQHFRASEVDWRDESILLSRGNRVGCVGPDKMLRVWWD